MNKFIAAMAVVVSALVCLGHAGAAEITLLSPQAMRPVLVDLIPQFERSSGHTVAIRYGSAASLLKSVEQGEVADVVILSPNQIEQLQGLNKIVAGSSLNLAKVGFGIMIRKGAPKIDISSAEALKKLLIGAAAIGSGDPNQSASGRYFAVIVERLGVTDALKPKTKLFPSGSAMLMAIAGGEVELGLEVISAADASGIELAGPLPPQLQSYNAYAAGVLLSARHTDVAKALISFVSTPGSLSVIKGRGFETP